ncbi:Zn-finger in ubiquitin-hydrolases and other protein, putative [Leishmania shawi]|uniref:Zn-finger in ubiquitin-hydrolase protein n=1 Tax=Leishmania shawi TaxID=5680 RepID=A0ABR3EGT0_9TRYP
MDHIPFCVAYAAACSFSGCAIVVLACLNMQDVLSVLQVCADMAAQGNGLRTSSMYVKGFPCLEGVPTTVDAQVLTSYYYIPTCPLCGDRLECTVSGYDSQTSMCACARSSSASQCTCFLGSSCHLCRRFADSLEHVQQQQRQQKLTASAAIKCEACAKAGDPWICLICGYVGCSRYQAMHAKDHCVAQQHFFSMNLLTQQIWDYDGDSFVHRVVILLDSDTGTSTWMQFPGRNEPILHDTATGESAAVGTAVSDTPETWKAEKKSISAKYDKKLTSSHAQYAMVIKSELDAKRALYESQLAQEAGDGDVDEDDLEKTELGNGAASASAEDVERGEYMELTNAFEPLNSVLMDVGEKRRKMTALLYAVKNLEHEQNTRDEETRRLEQQLESCKKALRSVIQQNVAMDLRLSSSIRELKEALQDIALNSDTQRRLAAQLGDQGVARVVLCGGSGSTVNAQSSAPPVGRGLSEKISSNNTKDVSGQGKNNA